MSWNNRQQSITLAADADLSSHQYKIVELTNTGCQLAGTGGIGILQNIPQSGEAATVAVFGESKFMAGGTIAIGNHIRVKSGGWGVAVASADTTPLNVIGVALNAVASGAIATMLIRPYAQASVVSGSVLTQPDA